jgi:hypothetical protein
MGKIKTESGIPNAYKFINKYVRGSQYTFYTAIADLIDNCIGAGAENVYIDVNLQELTLCMLDDGVGMTDSLHSEAMKIAAETRDYEDDDLGKFGTGMKAASLSQCKKLTVATRSSESNRVSVRRLDVEHIRETNDWDQLTLVLDEDSLPEKTLDALRKNTGTAVLWEDLDKIFVNKTLSAVAAKQELRNQLSVTEDHLAMTFHRFLSGTTKSGRKISISINGAKIKPWDPFVLDEPRRTELLDGPQLTVGGHHVKLTGFVLPGEKEFSTQQAFKAAGGPNKWVQSQGFWVYRNDRLIRGGGWLRMRSPDPHYSLARIALDFPATLDDVFQIDVAKSNVDLPLKVREDLDPFVKTVLSRAKWRYGSQSKLMGISVAGLPGKTVGVSSLAQRKMTSRALADLIEKVAKASGLTEEFKKLQTALREQNSSVADEIGW